MQSKDEDGSAFYDVNMTDADEGLTVLHVAAHNGAINCMQLLIDAGADLNHNSQHAAGYSPLHWAISQVQYRSAIILLMAGADPNVAGKEGMAPLHMAAKKTGEVGGNLVQLLCTGGDLGGADVEQVHRPQNSNGHAFQYTALHHAAAVGAVEAADVLLHFGGNPLRDFGNGPSFSPYAMANGQNHTVVGALFKTAEDTGASGYVGQTLRRKGLLKFALRFFENGIKRNEQFGELNASYFKETIGVAKKKPMTKLLRLVDKYAPVTVTAVAPDPPPPTVVTVTVTDPVADPVKNAANR